MPYTVTPWDVKGRVDYDKLIREFGTKRITPTIFSQLEQAAGSLHTMLRRRFFFSHKDLDVVLKDHAAGRGFFLYTGIALAGPMHIGHLLPFIMTRWLQDAFRVNCYIQIPDEEKFLARRSMTLEKVDSIVQDTIADIAAVGFDPERTFIFRNREYATHCYTMAVRVAKKITLSTAKAVFGFTNETNIGMVFYPAMQVVPTFFEKKRCLIPAGVDQSPYWRIQRDIAESLGYCKTAEIHNRFLPPLTGPTEKMSSSRPESAVLLTDAPETVKEKIMKHAFSGGRGSLKEHREKGGNPDIDVAFQWLSILFEESDTKLCQLEQGYRSGAVTTGEMKSHLIKKLNAFLSSHQKRKKAAGKRVRKLMRDGRLAREMWEKVF